MWQDYNSGGKIKRLRLKRVAMPFKHKSGCKKRQERKEQEEKTAKLPKLDSFGFFYQFSPSEVHSKQHLYIIIGSAWFNYNAALM